MYPLIENKIKENMILTYAQEITEKDPKENFNKKFKYSEPN